MTFNIWVDVCSMLILLFLFLSYKIKNSLSIYRDDVFVSSTRWQISLPFSFIIVFLFFCITNKPRLCTEQIFFL